MFPEDRHLGNKERLNAKANRLAKGTAYGEYIYLKIKKEQTRNFECCPTKFNMIDANEEMEPEVSRES